MIEHSDVFLMAEGRTVARAMRNCPTVRQSVRTRCVLWLKEMPALGNSKCVEAPEPLERRVYFRTALLSVNLKIYAAKSSKGVPKENLPGND